MAPAYSRIAVSQVSSCELDDLVKTHDTYDSSQDHYAHHTRV